MEGKYLLIISRQAKWHASATPIKLHLYIKTSTQNLGSFGSIMSNIQQGSDLVAPLNSLERRQVVTSRGVPRAI